MRLMLEIADIVALRRGTLRFSELEAASMRVSIGTATHVPSVARWPRSLSRVDSLRSRHPSIDRTICARAAVCRSGLLAGQLCDIPQATLAQRSLLVIIRNRPERRRREFHDH